MKEENVGQWHRLDLQQDERKLPQTKKRHTHTDTRSTQNLNQTRPEKKFPKAYHNQHTKYTGKKGMKAAVLYYTGPKRNLC